MLRLLALVSFGLVLSLARGEESPATLRWIDAATLPLEGRGWTTTKSPFDRLPASAEGVVRGPVFSLGRDAAGLALHFTTNSPRLRVRWKLRRTTLAMNHFAATGVSGVDLYVRHGESWRWAAVGRPDKPTNDALLFEGLSPQSREFRLYLPLYNGVEKLELGVEPTAEFTAAPSDPRPPIVFYGTSVVQGGCASRPGMAYPAIIGRRLGRPTLNLGFSGNGRAEPEVAALLAELSPAAYVIDTLGNLLPAEAPRVEAFVATLRRARPQTPIVLVENLAYPDSVLVPARRERHMASNAVLNEIFHRLRRNDPHLHLVPATNLLGDDNEATVDGSHPNDLGFNRIADELTPVLRALLPPAGS